MLKWTYVLAFILTTFINQTSGQNTLKDKKQWIDSQFNSMSEDEKIGQLFNIKAFSNRDLKHEQFLTEQIEKYHIGGVTFFQGTPYKQVAITNRLQEASKTPLMVAMDAEWGLGMRFKENGINFPRQLALGAINDNKEIYAFGKEVARELRRIGVHMNFAPVVDINNNPNNPVIHDRSFGEDKYNVTAKSYMYMKGMQDHGILACAKHFPGHGDTNVDSHKDLPVINHNMARLDSLELYPFRILSRQGLASVMIAHLYIPAIDDRDKIATTLSHKAVTGILKDDLGFEGLIITDALDMQGVAKYHPLGELEVKALEAGNDILLLSEDVGVAITAIKGALKQGRISWQDIDDSVKKILAAKYDVGLNKYTPASLDNLFSEVNSLSAKKLNNELMEATATVVANQDNLLPLLQIPDELITISIGSSSPTTLQKELSKLTNTKNFNVAGSDASKLSSLASSFVNDTIVVSLHKLSKSSRSNFGISQNVSDFIEKLQKSNRVIVTVFNTPYTYLKLPTLRNSLEMYTESTLTETHAAHIIMGIKGYSGTLPISLQNYRNTYSRQSLGRMSYASPESVGMDSEILSKIDSIANAAIKIKATPGCQVLVAKDGKIVFEKAYGHHTYNKKQKVLSSDIYDVASVTKIMATTLSVMKLYEQGSVDIFGRMGTYIPQLDTTNKKNLVITDILSHHGQLNGWIPFYKDVIRENSRKRYLGLKPEYFQKKKTTRFPVQVSDNVYMHNTYLDSMWNKIYTSNLREVKSYKYSDLGFILSGRMVENASRNTLDQYAYNEFYKPLGLKNITFRPLHNSVEKTRIPPTEKDRYFRNQTVHGHVHDMASAMFGGVAGHAGLFSNAKDLAVIMQMLLNDGYYGGRQYLNASTINLFTNRYNHSRRGLGFDLKELDTTKTINMSEKASQTTFGHLGFTGTCVWADKENNLIYIFLSNRTYPSMNNYKLNKDEINTRPSIQSCIYESLVR